MRAVVFSPEARQDLVDVWQFIAHDSVRAADRVKEKIQKALDRLAEMPGLGHTRLDVQDPRYRFWKVYSYLIVYRYDPANLTVIRIVHGARNLRILLNDA